MRFCFHEVRVSDRSVGKRAVPETTPLRVRTSDPRCGERSWISGPDENHTCNQSLVVSAVIKLIK